MWDIVSLATIEKSTHAHVCVDIKKDKRKNRSKIFIKIKTNVSEGEYS